MRCDVDYEYESSECESEYFSNLRVGTIYGYVNALVLADLWSRSSDCERALRHLEPFISYTYVYTIYVYSTYCVRFPNSLRPLHYS